MDGREREIWNILRAQTGDRTAFDALLASVQEPLFRYIVRLTGDADMAADILQDVFVLFWRKLPFLREPRLFRAWMYRLANREAFRRMRRERLWREQVREETVLEAIPDDSPAPPAEEWDDALQTAVTELPPASRAVIVLHYQRDLTTDEIAAALEIPLGTVKSRLSYGLSRLRQRLKGTPHAGTRTP